MVSFVDMTSHYYGGFFHVAVMAEIVLRLCPEYCPEGVDYEAAVSSLGDSVHYRQKLERMGVHGDEVDAIRNALIDRFIETSASYLTDPNFPARVVSAELAKLRKPKTGSALRFSAG